MNLSARAEPDLAVHRLAAGKGLHTFPHRGEHVLIDVQREAKENPGLRMQCRAIRADEIVP